LLPTFLRKKRIFGAGKARYPEASVLLLCTCFAGGKVRRLYDKAVGFRLVELRIHPRDEIRGRGASTSSADQCERAILVTLFLSMDDMTAGIGHA
jgi:hypothetical protein